MRVTRGGFACAPLADAKADADAALPVCANAVVPAADAKAPAALVMRKLRRSMLGMESFP